ncbi:SusD/RagB family nutrient-binding outer membrane lipoprotein [Chitinophaga horti]|uniref:SusD/RagB family nutrient-binding outer membrane lipoprotein n=1 Tax=Chitinophaga horti TaxID=2920382 RepID=A0ABY6J5P9_9BACT|nr:SusD/RagB family nutrient-binding outer membrane lipoprotein [Chitinophaga horti]UYQ93907.1 SusD/RagB family nutrient-binding outer membrane lipoprotein [Chitinophaga horti]
MKIINKFGIGVLALATFASSCTRDFEELNTNPEVSTNIQPELLFTSPAKAIVDRDFDWYYDNYAYLMRWMQFSTNYPIGNSGGMFNAQNTNNLYQGLYNNIGRNLTEIHNLVEKLDSANKPRYQHVDAIASVLKTYAAFRVSDANGSIPYSEAWKARSEANFLPAYDTQQELFATWDADLKVAVAVLAQDLPNQVSYGTGDIFYSGDRAKWAAAANALRLKIAMRLWKRNPEKTREVATEVMASPAGLMTSIDNEWKFVSSTGNFAVGGNWMVQGNNPSRAAASMLNFMYDNADPRLRLFYQPNAFTQTVFNSLKTAGVFPESAVYNPRQYIGAPSSPDAVNNPATAALFGVKNYTLNGQTVNYDTLSTLQNRLFDLSADGGASGQYTQPILSYAEQCFMIAELAVRGVVTQDAQEWYNRGVTASIRAYDRMGSIARIVGYTAVTDQQINAYLQTAVVAFTGTDEQKLEKIGVQNHINHYKAPWEAWGDWKRTGYPKVGGILPFEPFTTNGTVLTVPRRWALPLPNNSNMANYNAAIEEMRQSGEYGAGPEEITGRVWWDKR